MVSDPFRLQGKCTQARVRTAGQVDPLWIPLCNGTGSLIPLLALLQTYLQSPPLGYFGLSLHLLARLMTYSGTGSEKICYDDEG